MTRIPDQLERTSENVMRCIGAAAGVLRSMRDGMGGQPKGRTYDPQGFTSHEVVLYCETHERDLTDCTSPFCTGKPVAVQSDPTGDAAINAAAGRDVASRDHRQLQRIASSLERLSEQAVDIMARWQVRPPTAAEIKETEAANETGNCEVCMRSQVTSPAIVSASTAKDNLPRPYRLCRWHLDFALSYGRLPNDAEEKRHHDGGRVRVRAS